MPYLVCAISEQGIAIHQYPERLSGSEHADDLLLRYSAFTEHLCFLLSHKRFNLFFFNI